MKSTKKLLWVISCIAMAFFITMTSNAQTIHTEIIDSQINDIVNEYRQAVFSINRIDIADVLLEYSINDEPYTTQQKSINNGSIEFSVDCSIPGKYSLDFLHVTYKDGNKDSLAIDNESFSVAPSQKYLQQLNSLNAQSLSNKRASANNKKVVVIDPGHCKAHSGAARDELREEVLNYKIALAAYNELKAYNNVEVYLTCWNTNCPTPGSNMATCLLARAQLARDKNADLFVSIHNNATGAVSQTSSSGAYVYISNHSRYSSSSRRLTDYILAEFKSRIGLPTHGAWINADDGTYGEYEDGRLKDDLSVIRNCVLFGIEPILIEHAYMNNPTDKAVLRNDAKLTQMGIGDAAGIAKYLGLKKVDWDATGFTANVSGSNVSFIPSVTGNTSGLKYKYVFNKYNPSTGKYDWTTWGVIRDFSTAKNFTWNAPGDGKYEIYLDVTDGAGNIVNLTNTVNIEPNVGFNGINLTGGSNVGNTVTISPNISNSSGLKYKFVYSYNDWQKWGVIKNFSDDHSASFTLQNPGKYEFIIDIMSPSGATASRSTFVTSSLGWKATNISFNKSPVKRNTQVKITGNVNNNNGLKYKFVYSYNNWQKWGVIRNFSNIYGFNFKPQLKGKYDIYMDVQDSYGNVQTISRPINVY